MFWRVCEPRAAAAAACLLVKHCCSVAAAAPWRPRCAVFTTAPAAAAASRVCAHMHAGLALCWRTWCLTRSHARSTMTTGEFDFGALGGVLCWGLGLWGQGVWLCVWALFALSHARSTMTMGEFDLWVLLGMGPWPWGSIRLLPSICRSPTELPNPSNHSTSTPVVAAVHMNLSQVPDREHARQLPHSLHHTTSTPAAAAAVNNLLSPAGP
jgi:hypothetical protein